MNVTTFDASGELLTVTTRKVRSLRVVRQVLSLTAMQFGRVLTITTTLSLLLVGHARAEQSLESSSVISESAPSAGSLRLDAGLFSPVGELGVVYSRPIHPQAAMELGAGVGFSGVQLSGMAKLQLGRERTKFTPGIGVSVGLPMLGSSVHEGHPNPDDNEMRGAPVTMAWLDVDLLGVQHRTRSGLVLTASGGVTLAMTKGHWDTADLGDDIRPLDALPQFRLGVGKAF
jgi:hypothetical protein